MAKPKPGKIIVNDAAAEAMVETLRECGLYSKFEVSDKKMKGRTIILVYETLDKTS